MKVVITPSDNTSNSNNNNNNILQRRSDSSGDMPNYLQVKSSNFAASQAQGINLFQGAKRIQGKRIIESRIGVSKESPFHFRTSFGLVSKDTYENPFLNPRQAGSQGLNSDSLKNKQTFSIFSKLTEDLRRDVFHIQKVKTIPSYNLLTHENTPSKRIDVQINERPKFNEEYLKVIQSRGSNPFHRKANYFSDFTERNDQMNVFGQLNSTERAEQFRKVKDFSLSEQELNEKLQARSRRNLSQYSKGKLSSPSTSFDQLGDESAAAISHPGIELTPQRKTNSKKKNSFHLKSLSSTMRTSSIERLASKSALLEDFKMKVQAGQPTRKHTWLASINGEQSSALPLLSQQKLGISKSLANLKLVSGGTTLSGSTWKSKNNLKIVSPKFNKVSQDEAIKELESLEEFERILHFNKGNNLAGAKMGSVFFQPRQKF